MKLKKNSPLIWGLVALEMAGGTARASWLQSEKANTTDNFFHAEGDVRFPRGVAEPAGTLQRLDQTIFLQGGVETCVTKGVYVYRLPENKDPVAKGAPRTVIFFLFKGIDGAVHMLAVEHGNTNWGTANGATYATEAGAIQARLGRARQYESGALLGFQVARTEPSQAYAGGPGEYRQQFRDNLPKDCAGAAPAGTAPVTPVPLPGAGLPGSAYGPQVIVPKPEATFTVPATPGARARCPAGARCTLGGQ